MDTSKEYVLMCEKAVDIQKYWVDNEDYILSNDSFRDDKEDRCIKKRVSRTKE